MRDLATLTAADFAELEGDAFRVVPEGAAPFDVQLVAVLAQPAGGAGRAPFSLQFAGGPTPPLPQRIHRLEHAALGALVLFLVPIGPDRYEAVFT